MDSIPSYKKGSMIAGRWRVIRELGRGGMGQVLLAEDESGGQVAIKILRRVDFKQQKRFIERFKAEFSILKELSHPGINRVYDFGLDELGNYFFSTEYIAGNTFLDAVEDSSAEEIEELFIQVLRALQYLHSHGIMHSDIKSQNVLVSRAGGEVPSVKVIDFGLAMLGTPDRIVGTPAYMAPEVILKNRPDSRADLYSLGVLIYAALTRVNPFKADDMDGVFHLQLSLCPEAPSRLNSRVPPYLDKIILKLLEKNPADRPLTAAHVIRAMNFGGGRSYPIETAETFMAYIPAEGNLVGRKREMEAIKNQCISIRDGKSPAPLALFIAGEAGTGRKRLLSELKYFSQLNEMDVISLHGIGENDMRIFCDRLSSLMAEKARPTVVIVSALGPLAASKDGTRATALLRKCVKWLRMSNAAALGGRRMPVFIAFSALPDEMPFLTGVMDLPYGGDGEFSVMELKNFGRDETASYLKALCGVEDIPEKFLEGIFNHTQGNPYFITEIVKQLIRDGKLYDAQGRWNSDAIEDLGVRLEDVKVPAGIGGVAMRIYRGGLPEERAMLEILSVLHGPASLDEICAVENVGDARSVLLSLVNRGIASYDAQDGSYGFANPLFGSAVYDGMPPESRHRLHESAAAYLKKTEPDALEKINWHIGRCEGLEPAVDALIVLGTHHLKESCPADAVAAFEYALSRIGDNRYRLAEMLLHLGESYVLMRRYDDAVSAYGRLSVLQEGDPRAGAADRALTHQRQGVAYLRSGKLDEALDAFRKAEAVLEGTTGSESARMRISNFIARAMFLKGDLNAALDIYRINKATWNDLPGDEKLKVLNNDLAHVYLQKGELDLAESEFKSDIEYLDGIGACFELERAYYAISEIYMKRGSVDVAIDRLNKSASIAKKLSDPELMLRAYNGLGSAYRAKENPKEGVYWYERALDLAMRTGDESSAAGILLNIGLIKSEEGLYDDAIDCFISSINIFKKASNKTNLDYIYLQRANAELEEAYRRKKGKAAEATEDVSVLDIGINPSDAKGDDMESKRYRYILEINKYLGGEADLGFVLKSILKYALELSGAHAGIVLLADDDGKLEIKSACNIEVDDKLSEVGVGIARSAIEGDKIVTTDNAVDDDRFRSFESVMDLGLKSVICIPIHARKRAMGVLYLENRDAAAAFASADREVLIAFADQAGIAIDNARMMSMYEGAGRELKDELDQSHAEIEKLEERIKSQSVDMKGAYRFDKLASASAKMKSVFQLLERISGSELSVCIVGESGTGKELIAKAVHCNSHRSGGAFVVINCGAIPATLIESELFGYKAGAFTGAARDKMGLFEAAKRGTIFLDEIAELDISLQAKLLRVLQEREIMRVGDTKTIKCDVRVICATNKNLEEQVKANAFRQDLYYRIAEIKVELPALRNRTEDIPVLIDEFVDGYCRQHGMKKIPKADPSFIRACMSYGWPGNIRELENAVRVAAALSDGGVISLSALPDNHVLRCAAAGPASGPIAAAEGPRQNIDEHNAYDSGKIWRQYEAEIVASAYKSCGFNAKETSENLGIAIATVYKKIGELDLKDRGNSLYASQFKYVKGKSLDDYIVMTFRAAWESSGRSPYKAARTLGVSHGYFYKVMKKFG